MVKGKEFNFSLLAYAFISLTNTASFSSESFVCYCIFIQKISNSLCIQTDTMNDFFIIVILILKKNEQKYIYRVDQINTKNLNLLDKNNTIYCCYT